MGIWNTFKKIASYSNPITGAIQGYKDINKASDDFNKDMAKADDEFNKEHDE